MPQRVREKLKAEFGVRCSCRAQTNWVSCLSLTLGLKSSGSKSAVSHHRRTAEQQSNQSCTPSSAQTHTQQHFRKQSHQNKRPICCSDITVLFHRPGSTICYTLISQHNASSWNSCTMTCFLMSGIWYLTGMKMKNTQECFQSTLAIKS